MSDDQLTCFVVTGFGKKTDHATGRVLDLDKTFSHLEPPPYIPPDQRAMAAPEGESLADVLTQAEAAIKSTDFDTAIDLLQGLVDAHHKAEVKPDVYIVQKLALATYKAGQHRSLDSAAAMEVLYRAETILETHCAPAITNDPETLGLAGAINKRLFDLTGDATHLDHAIGFYERGFHIKQDYYNGINAAFMYTLRATRLENRFDAIVSYGHANMIRARVAAICEALLRDEDEAATRGDREWITLTLAEAYFGMGRTAETERLERKIDAQASAFAKSSYAEQKARLATLIAEFERGAPPDEPSSHIAPVQTPQPSTDSSGRITFRPDIAPGKSVRSIKVTYQVDYD